jgi:hypothetical protein
MDSFSSPTLTRAQEAKAHGNLVNAHILKGDYTRGCQVIQQALAVFEAFGDWDQDWDSPDGHKICEHGTQCECARGHWDFVGPRPRERGRPRLRERGRAPGLERELAPGQHTQATARRRREGVNGSYSCKIDCASRMLRARGGPQ